MTARLLLVLMAAFMSGCAGVAVRRSRAELALGLFEVVARQCENPLELEFYPCEWVHYIEVVRDPEVTPDGLTLLEWLAPPEEGEEYAYSAWSLDGYFVEAHTYLVDDVEQGSTSLVVDGRELREFRSFMRRGSHESTDPRENERAAHDPVALAKAREVIASMRLTLKRVARTPALDALLRYPPPD